MKKLLIHLTLVLALFGTLLFRVPLVQAQAPTADCNPTTTNEALKCGTDNSAGVPVGSDPGNSLSDTIANVLNVMSAVIAALATVMIIVGGARFVASGGKEDSVKGAKSTITYAIVGLIVVALAQIVVHFVLNNVNQTTDSGATSSTTPPIEQPGGK